ncbi:MAG: hypothetical protein ACRC41_06940 [Sarcina sp.]
MDFRGKMPKKDKLKPIIAIVSSIVVFATVYLGSYYYKISTIGNGKDKTTDVMVKDSNEFNDSAIIYFTRKNINNEDEVYYKVTVGEFKKKLNVKELSKDELVKALEKEGYKQGTAKDGNLAFTKENGTGLEANKYYIGDKDGYVAIFKTDENGNAFIEKQSDISNRRTKNFPNPDIELIEGFELKFDTRQECEDIIINYTT